MTEADILATTYTDTCTVYRPGKMVLPSGESVFKKGLQGIVVCKYMPCALSNPSGGKLQRSTPVNKVPTDYLLFCRPEVDIQQGDTVEVTHLKKVLVFVAGLPDRQPSHNNIPLTLAKNTV